MAKENGFLGAHIGPVLFVAAAIVLCYWALADEPTPHEPVKLLDSRSPSSITEFQSPSEYSGESIIVHAKESGFNHPSLAQSQALNNGQASISPTLEKPTEAQEFRAEDIRGPRVEERRLQRSAKALDEITN